MTKINENIYKIEVPLPKSPLKILNCYVIKGDDRNLLIDTGFNTDESYNALISGLNELSISLDNTDIFLTHMHADHTGLSFRLKRPTNKIYISPPDGKRVNSFLDPAYWESLLVYQDYMGFPENERLSYENHPGYVNRMEQTLEFCDIFEGDMFNIGHYELEVVDIAGHTPGQMGLFEKKHKFMFSGDHILQKVTPNINMWDFEHDYLGLYLKNLKKIRDKDIETLYSSHRDIITMPKVRIDELISHHDSRLNVILHLISNGANTVFKISNNMKWDYGTGDFSLFPPAQKWFASLEVFAHVEYLRRQNLVSLNISGDEYSYFVESV